MPGAMLARYHSIIARPNGLVLVTGPAGSGKTTTLYVLRSTHRISVRWLPILTKGAGCWGWGCHWNR